MRVTVQILDATTRMKYLLYLVTVVYFVSSLTGFVLIYFKMPFAVSYDAKSTESTLANPVISLILSALKAGNLPTAMAYTFLWNMFHAVFATTVLPAVIPLVGAIIPLGVSAITGFETGLTLYHALGISPAYFILAVGATTIELAAYVFSSAAGINISLSVAFPRTYLVTSRVVAIKMACLDALRAYILVTILLALSAFSETVIIYFGRVRI